MPHAQNLRLSTELPLRPAPLSLDTHITLCNSSIRKLAYVPVFVASTLMYGVHITHYLPPSYGHDFLGLFSVPQNHKST